MTPPLFIFLQTVSPVGIVFKATLKTMKTGQPHLLTPWRLFFQWATTIGIFVLPFIQIENKSVFRIDIPSFSLILFGTRFSIEEMYLFWLLAISLIFLFLLLTLILGRVWCGWACPQTTINDMAESVTEWLSLRLSGNRIRGSLWKKGVLFLFYVGIGLLVGSNCVWYFVSPYDFFPLVLDGRLGPWPLGTVITISILVFVDLAFLRRIVCKEFCPYGRFQMTLVDKGTLTIWYPPDEAERCIDCHACVRVCPTGIDIRKGYQVECIHCVKCLDACKVVMAKRRQSGIIRYSFGQENNGFKGLLTIRTALIFFVFIVVSSSFVIASFTRSAASLKITPVRAVKARLLEGDRMATFFSGYLVNKSKMETTYGIDVSNKQGEKLQIEGPAHSISLAAGEMKRFSLVVVSNFVEIGRPLPVVFIVNNQEKEEVARATSFIPVLREP